MNSDKIIHFDIFKPHNALFKAHRNNKAKSTVIRCNNDNNCGFHKRGECLIQYTTGLFNFHGRCLYGNRQVYAGFSPRSSKYYSWMKDQEKRYDGIPFLNKPTRISIVKDYVALPYFYLDMYENFPFEKEITLSVKKEDFTVENIIKIIHFIPKTLFGNNEIPDYQEKIVPKILKHLSEEMPDLFSWVIAADGYAKKMFAEFTNIGRKAILETLTPNVGEFKDIHGGLWKWNGKVLTSTNSHASFLLVSKFKELIVTPEEKQVVAITDEGQVNDNTVFKE